MIEIIISITEEGRFLVKKTEGIENFFAVGMIELAKQILLDPNNDFKSDEVVEDDVEVMEVDVDDVQ